MTSKERDFLDSIIADSDDDMARLVFADWLEENHNPERAEFIRVQIDRARLPHWDVRQVKLRIREQELLKKFEKVWRAELPDIKDVKYEGFHRGFVSAVKFKDFESMKAHIAECRRATPIDAARVQWPRNDDSLKGMPDLPWVRHLTVLRQQFNTKEVTRLATSPILSTLRTLNVSESALGIKGFRKLLSSPYLGNLRSLNAAKNSIGNKGPKALAKAKSLTSLEELDLSDVSTYGGYGGGYDPKLKETGLKELVNWPGMKRLRSLSISGSDIGRVGLQYLLSSENAVGLKKLVIRDSDMFGQAMLEFGLAHKDLQLEELDLSMNMLEDFGFENLASAGCLEELKVLNLETCEIGPNGLRELAWSPFISSLRLLNLKENDIEAEGVKYLLDAGPKELHTLSLRFNRLRHDAVDHLASSSASNTLQELDLSQNLLGGKVANTLAQTKELKNLQILKLKFNGFDKKDTKTLTESPLGKRLAILEGLPDPDQDDSKEDIPF